MSDEQERNEEPNDVEPPSEEKSDETPKENSDEAPKEKEDEIPKEKTPTTEAPPEADSVKYVKLKVVGNNDQSGIHFKLKMTTPLLKLKKAYSTHKDIPVSGLRFLFDGKRISDEDTPMELGMTDDDQIEVYHEQTGGT